MNLSPQTIAGSLLRSRRYLTAKSELVQAIQESSSKIRGIRSSSPELRSAYADWIREFQSDRARDLFFPYLSTSFGNGPFIELADGSLKYDLSSGIGISFFGHTHPELVAEMIDVAAHDVMQGNLQPGIEAAQLIRAVVSRVGSESRLKHGWLLCSGTMSNEMALKMIRQKKAPATKVLAFRDCFAGRSTAMQEITDIPSYRSGQPVYGEVEYLSFYDPALGLERSIELTLGEMKRHLERFPDKFAALMLELVQGEGGFKVAPREFYIRVFEEAKKRGLAIWADEVQTFGRTGELFAFQKLELSSYIDVCTIGKLLHACMVLYTSEMNPRPGLIAGTFTGSGAALRTGRRVLELLDEGNYLGKTGRIETLSSRFVSHLRQAAEGRCKGMINEVRSFGGMIAFQFMGGTLDETKALIMSLFDRGVVTYYCGHGPYLIRLLPPLGCITEEQIDEVCGVITDAVVGTAKAGASGK